MPSDVSLTLSFSPPSFIPLWRLKNRVWAKYAVFELFFKRHELTLWTLFTRNRLCYRLPDEPHVQYKLLLGLDDLNFSLFRRWHLYCSSFHPSRYSQRNGLGRVFGALYEFVFEGCHVCWSNRVVETGVWDNLVGGPGFRDFLNPLFVVALFGYFLYRVRGSCVTLFPLLLMRLV